MKYLKTGKLPENGKQAHRLRIQAACFTLINDQIYKQSFGGSYLKYLSKSEAKYVLAKLYEGIWGNHLGGQTLAHRAYKKEYY